MSSESCSVCAEVAGRISVPGGVVYRNEWWEVAHHTRPQTDPGELIVKLRRHAESLAELTPAEAAALGPVLRAAVAAVERVVRRKRVYVASLWRARAPRNIFLLPRTTSLPRPCDLGSYRRGRTLLRRRASLPNPPAAARADAAARLRDDTAWMTSTTSPRAGPGGPPRGAAPRPRPGARSWCSRSARKSDRRPVPAGSRARRCASSRPLGLPADAARPALGTSPSPVALDVVARRRAARWCTRSHGATSDAFQLPVGPRRRSLGAGGCRGESTSTSRNRPCGGGRPVASDGTT